MRGMLEGEGRDINHIRGRGVGRAHNKVVEEIRGIIIGLVVDTRLLIDEGRGVQNEGTGTGENEGEAEEEE